MPITFKSEADRQGIIAILEAPTKQKEQYAATLERLAKIKPQPAIATMSPHFEHRKLTEAEKQELIAKHIEESRRLNDSGIMKKKVQRDSKGDSVERYALHIDISKSQYQPPEYVSTGQVKNVIQARVDSDGPRRGHWATDQHGKPIYRNGRRLWIDGQHNYNRQRDPRNPDEAILGTRLMNRNMRLSQCRDEKGELVKELVEDARIVQLGKARKVFDRSSQSTIFDDAAKAAAAIIRKQFLNTNIPAAISNSAKAEGKTESRAFRGAHE